MAPTPCHFFWQAILLLEQFREFCPPPTPSASSRQFNYNARSWSRNLHSSSCLREEPQSQLAPLGENLRLQSALPRRPQRRLLNLVQRTKNFSFIITMSMTSSSANCLQSWLVSRMRSRRSALQLRQTRTNPSGFSHQFFANPPPSFQRAPSYHSPRRFAVCTFLEEWAVVSRP